MADRYWLTDEGSDRYYRLKYGYGIPGDNDDTGNKESAETVARLAKEDIEAYFTYGVPLSPAGLQRLEDAVTYRLDYSEDISNYLSGSKTLFRPLLDAFLAAGGELHPSIVPLVKQLWPETASADLALSIRNTLANGNELSKNFLTGEWDKPGGSAEIENQPGLLDAFRMLPGNEEEYVNFLNEAIANVLARGGSMASEDAVKLLDRLATIDQRRAINYLQQHLMGQIASGKEPDATVMKRLFDPGNLHDEQAWAEIAAAWLTSQIEDGRALDSVMLEQLRTTDPVVWAEVMVTKLKSQVDRHEATTIDDYNALKTASPSQWRNAVVYLLTARLKRNEIPSPAELGLLNELNTPPAVDLSAYLTLGIGILKLQISRGITPDATIYGKVLAANPTAAAQILTLRLDWMLRTRTIVDNDVLNELRPLDQVAAAAVARNTMAFAFQRGVLLDTISAPPLANSYLDTLRSTYEVLKQVDPNAAAEWSASFEALIDETPINEIELTLAQRNAMASWSAAMTRAMDADGSILDDVGQIGGNSPREVDLATLFTATLLDRAVQLDLLLKEQMDNVQKKNDDMARMNNALGALNRIEALLPSTMSAADSLGSKIGTKLTANNGELLKTAIAAMEAAGIAPFTPQLSDKTTKGDLASAIQQLKSQIDSAGNNQQTEMLRLQSLMSKREQAFQLLAELMKKYFDGIEGIIRLI